MNLIKSLSSLIVFVLASCYPAPKAAGQFTDQEFDQMAEEMAKGEAKDITVADLQDNKEKTILLDSRERNEFDVSHIPGAIWVGYDDFNIERVSSLDKNAKIIVYCSVGYRSERISEKLQTNGFNNVYNLKGSIFDWVNKGYKLEDAKGKETNKIHGYNKKWSKWLKNGEVVF